MTEQRIRSTLGSVNTEALLVDALAQVGVQARTTAGAPDQGIDLILDPGEVEVQVKVWVGVFVGVALLNKVLVEVADGVFEAVALGVSVTLGVFVGEAEGVAVSVADGVGVVEAVGLLVPV